MGLVIDQWRRARHPDASDADDEQAS